MLRKLESFFQQTQSPERKVQDSAVANVTMNVSDASHKDTLQQTSSPNVSIQGTQLDQVTPQTKEGVDSQEVLANFVNLLQIEAKH